MAEFIAHILNRKHDDSVDVNCHMLGGVTTAANMATFAVLTGVAAPAAAPVVAGLEGFVEETGSAMTANAARSSPWTYVKGMNSGTASRSMLLGASQLQQGLNFASNFPMAVNA